MGLWRVEIAKVVHRYVQAADADSAVALVREDLIQAMELRAERADRSLESRVESAPLERRARLLASLNGIAPRPRLETTPARIAWLEEALRQARADQQWLDSQLAAAPPFEPERLQAVVRLLASNRTAVGEGEGTAPG